MPVFHRAVSYDDVLAGHVPFPSVRIPAALDGDAVVPGVEGASFDQDILAGFRVATIPVRPFVPYFYILDRDVLGEERMDHPEWRAQEGNPLDQDPLALIELDELRSHSFALQVALFYGHVPFCHLEQQRSPHLL